MMKNGVFSQIIRLGLLWYAVALITLCISGEQDDSMRTQIPAKAGMGCSYKVEGIVKE